MRQRRATVKNRKSIGSIHVRQCKIAARSRIVRSARQAVRWRRQVLLAKATKAPFGGAFVVTLVRKVVMLHVYHVAVSLRGSCAGKGLDRRADRLLFEVGQHFSRVPPPAETLSVYTNRRRALLPPVHFRWIVPIWRWQPFGRLSAEVALQRIVRCGAVGGDEEDAVASGFFLEEIEDDGLQGRVNGGKGSSSRRICRSSRV